MPTVEAKLEIQAAPDELFDLAQDYALRLRWDPFLREMRFRDGAREAAVGVRVWVRARNGLSMEVEYVTLERPRSVAMKMVDGPRMFERFAGSWRFDATGAQRTTVTFRYGYQTRWPWLRPLLNHAVQALFARDVRARLRGLKRAAEQGGLLGELHGERGGGGAGR